MNFYMIIQ